MSRTKQKWRLDYEKNAALFAREIATKKPGLGAIAMYLCRGDHLLAGVLEGDALALRAMQGIGQWLATTGKLAPGNAPLCLTCETEFSRGAPKPAAFLITTPYSKTWGCDKTAVLVSGVCAPCSARSDADLLAHARELWLQNNPGSFEMPSEGHA
jgi:hypothetical protein